MRDRLTPWFGLGETLAFAAGRDCAAAVFRVRHGAIGAGIAVEDSVRGMLRALPGRGVAAVDHVDLTPDAVMVEAVNTHRPSGMAMRRAVLEARPCMDAQVEGEFRRQLERPESVLAYDTGNGAIMLLDRKARVLVVAMGARA
ncbi:MAG: hypothetical protein NXH84_16190 [Rhodobacteraceae bacterium]|nr:hypothetical protein [Paracoccaceae bacterium]